MPDIRMHQLNWLSLRDRALFFLPKVVTLAGTEGIRAGDIVSASKKLEKRFWLGPPVVRLVYSCQPVTWAKAEGVRRSVNIILANDEKTRPLEDRDIIACTLRMNSINEILNFLSWSDSDIAKSTKFSTSLINNVRRGGRIFLSAGIKIIDVIERKLATPLGPMQLVDRNNSGLPAAIESYSKKRYHEILSSARESNKFIYKISSDKSCVTYYDLLSEMENPDLYDEVW